MNPRIVGATTAALLLSLRYLEQGVRATGRTVGSIVATGHYGRDTLRSRSRGIQAEAEAVRQIV